MKSMSICLCESSFEKISVTAASAAVDGRLGVLG